MNEAPVYIVLIKGPEGLRAPQGDDQIVRENREAITDNFHTRCEQLDKAGVLEGITIQLRMEFTSALIINGPEEKIQKLKAYLTENTIGYLNENSK